MSLSCEVINRVQVVQEDIVTNPVEPGKQNWSSANRVPYYFT